MVTSMSTCSANSKVQFASLKVVNLYLLIYYRVLVAAAGRRQLRSSDAVTCLVPRTRTCLGDRAFGVAGPRLQRFADQPPSASRLPWTVPTGAKNAFI